MSACFFLHTCEMTPNEDKKGTEIRIIDRPEHAAAAEDKLDCPEPVMAKQLVDQ